MPEDTNLCDVCASGSNVALINGRPYCVDHFDTGMGKAFAPVKEALKMIVADPKPEPNAVECGNCSGISRSEDPQSVIMCVYCGTDDYLMPIVMTPCPNEHPADCDDENHHFGLNAHVDSSG